MRIGSARHINVDVRIIAATNKELSMACRRGTFREDLFYRLNVINIHLPLLKDRMEDVPYLVRHFMKKHAHKRKDILIKTIAEETMAILLNYPYPGNIRELENIIEHSISFANSPEILPSDLPAFLLQTPTQRIVSTPRLKETLADVEKELIWTALQRSSGNISKAAQELGIYRQQLQRKIKQLKIAT
jgi:transcriptional regulator with PAS, ATPase and Fis domain